MRLLPRKEIKEFQDEETQRLVKERADYASASALEIRKLNAVKAQSKRETEELEKGMNKKFQELVDERKQLSEEIEALKDEKKDLLKKLGLFSGKNTEEYKKIRKQYDEAVALLDKMKEKNRLLEADSAQVTVNLSKTAIALAEAEKAKKDAEEIRTHALDAERASLGAIDEKKKELSEREKLIVSNAEALKIERKEIDIEKETIKTMIAELEEKGKIIAHKEQMLANAFAEARKKNLL